MLNLTHVADLNIIVGAPVEAGDTISGSRRIVPVLGGEIIGPRIRGRILAAGADHQILRTDGVTELKARYVIEAEDGARIYVDNQGLRHGPPEAMDRLRRGEPVSPALIYFRTTPRFETANVDHNWLSKHIFAATGVRHPDRVELAVYQIL